MKETVRQARAEQRVIGFVPTMGALHAGHLALVQRARQDCSRVIASIFVNPKQFGPKEDLARYPRTLETDTAKLISAGVDSLFLPESAEIYPPGFSTYVSVEGLSERLEGRTRPGHFRGVSTVVLKLLEIVQPHFAYFGRKDAQQVRIISQMVTDLNLDTEIVVHPIVREADGIALSSRNAYLSSEERKAAGVLRHPSKQFQPRAILSRPPPQGREGWLKPLRYARPVAAERFGIQAAYATGATGSRADAFPRPWRVA